MTESLSLHLLTAADAHDMLAFEQRNRAHFARNVGDRGEGFDYPQHHAELLAQMERGESLLSLVRDAGGQLVGQVNFTRLRPGPASLGYRFAEEVGGKGWATAAVQNALALAQAAGVPDVRATVALVNPASRRVLEKLGFVPLDPQAASEAPAFVHRDGEKLAVEHLRRSLASLPPSNHFAGD